MARPLGAMAAPQQFVDDWRCSRYPVVAASKQALILSGKSRTSAAATPVPRSIT
jgi:hypothetical protein